MRDSSLASARSTVDDTNTASTRQSEEATGMDCRDDEETSNDTAKGDSTRSMILNQTNQLDQNPLFENRENDDDKKRSIESEHSAVPIAQCK